MIVRTVNHLATIIRGLSNNLNILHKLITNMNVKLYQTNVKLGVVAKQLNVVLLKLQQKSDQEALAEQRHLSTRSRAQKTVETEEPQEIPQGQIGPPIPAAEVDMRGEVETEAEITRGLEPPVDISRLDLELPVDLQADVSKEQRVSGQEPMDISDMPTQKLKRLSQHSASDGNKSPPKKLRQNDKDNQQLLKEKKTTEPVGEKDKENTPPDEVPITKISPLEKDKENTPPDEEPQQVLAKQDMRRLSELLQEAGLAEVQPKEAAFEPRATQGSKRAGITSDSSETQLGSLDRTKVSLGDSVKMTESQNFIRTEWGCEGTLLKIVSHVKAGMRPVTVDSLVAKGPVPVGCKRLIAALCFFNILNLKQHGFIKITKDPDSLAIQDICFGPKLDFIKK